MEKLILRKLSNLTKSQSQYLMELGYELRSCLGLETLKFITSCAFWRSWKMPAGCEGFYIIKVLSPGSCIMTPPPHIPGFQALPSQEVTVTPGGRDWSMPSQYTPPSLVSATLVKRVLLWIVAMALGLVVAEVPGATPKKPFSGLMARSRPVKRSEKKERPTRKK